MQKCEYGRRGLTLKVKCLWVNNKSQLNVRFTSWQQLHCCQLVKVMFNACKYHPKPLQFTCHFHTYKMCSAQESNPGHKNGNLAWYHYASSAYAATSIALIHLIQCRLMQTKFGIKARLWDHSDEGTPGWTKNTKTSPCPYMHRYTAKKTNPKSKKKKKKEEKKLCTARESNPGRKNGNHAWYHYTSSAYTHTTAA